jgi:hypothetical protein
MASAIAFGNSSLSQVDFRNAYIFFLIILINSPLEFYPRKRIRGKFGKTRSKKYVIFGGTFAEFFRILFGKFVWMSSKFGLSYEVLL